MTPEEIIKALDLQPLPVEGGLYKENLNGDPNASAIYYMLVAPQFSRLHKLENLEIFVYHAGAPARMLLLHPDGTVERPLLGMDLAAGERPQVIVPTGTWQATETTGEWSLLGTMMSPPYSDDIITYADAGILAAGYPAATEDISRLA
ncbi:putative cupin superfamily sugar epimerase [Kibdelosporangium banguiense]|uniref:Cupin superfamily sugar epimerase n=1 Tax=Kibdelosporangium banguiense TaxID=1365924 RepID=A0ABS4U0P7_9PSEU|nr:cupin domain-containing protein [Kibdelosporangium banguiense]MBP2330228.1 putative cupin superfamily sugar epimerase [Kibdelosporangium banguiense]